MKTTTERFIEHVGEAYEMYGDRLVMVALQGSQNYNLAYENSDVDTKALIVPTLEDIVLNRKPISTTHIRANEEHIDLKDVRLMFQSWRKQNINFVEILFSDWVWINPRYEAPIRRLIDASEEIARYNPYAAVKCMKGMALEKLHALEHPYPSKKEVLEKFGYDPKQLSHIFRLRNFLDAYIGEESYKDCLLSSNREENIAVKTGKYSLNDARMIASEICDRITKIADIYCERVPNEYNEATDQLMNDILTEIIKIAIKKEINK